MRGSETGGTTSKWVLCQVPALPSLPGWSWGTLLLHSPPALDNHGINPLSGPQRAHWCSWQASRRISCLEGHRTYSNKWKKYNTQQKCYYWWNISFHVQIDSSDFIHTAYLKCMYTPVYDNPYTHRAREGKSWLCMCSPGNDSFKNVFPSCKIVVSLWTQCCISLLALLVTSQGMKSWGVSGL